MDKNLPPEPTVATKWRMVFADEAGAPPIDKVIIWRMPGGGIALSRCCVEPEMVIPEILKQHPEYVMEAIVDPSEMPDKGKLSEDMTEDEQLHAVFRSAWALKDGKVCIDMQRARDVHRAHMRRARAPKLAALDVEYQRADETGNPAGKQDVAARKRALRDVTAHPAIEAAATLRELVTVWPDVLDSEVA